MFNNKQAMTSKIFKKNILYDSFNFEGRFRWYVDLDLDDIWISMY